MDCLYCERCRHNTPQLLKSSQGTLSHALLPVVYLIAIALVLIPLNKIGQNLSDTPFKTSPSLGVPRDVDIDLIRKMIQEHRLSDKEAWFYKKVEEEKK